MFETVELGRKTPRAEFDKEAPILRTLTCDLVPPKMLGYPRASRQDGTKVVAVARESAVSMDSRFAFAQDLVQEAGALARHHFDHRGALKVERKGLQDEVSEADREVEAIIRERIATAFPQDGFLGEESGATAASNGNAGPVWVVDPIDGTASFLAGIPCWCLSIALVSAGEIELGVVFDPNADELFAVRRGGGAWLNGTALPKPPAISLASGLFGIGFSHRRPPEALVPFVEGLLRAGGMFIRNGSGALMLAYVAAGRLIG